MHKTAMILAAGRGERMRPLTDTLPKPLLSIHQKALIEYHLEALKLAGYERVVINHAWLGQLIEAKIGNGSRYGLEVIYSPEAKALETAGGIVKALPLLCQTAQDCYFTVVNGDVFTDFDFANLQEPPLNATAHLVMVDNPGHNPDGDFYLDKNRLNVSQGKKLTFSGIAIYHKSFFDTLRPEIQPLAPMLKDGIKNNQVSAQYFLGNWTDVGTPERLAQLNT
ncbi:N-acetylmuramate alpha-1-phosphate uridylyltransferase MurU [Paraglaciecola sp. 2405UD69-4]|uniref:N-acetylmuramate alpha-1-phosphate uridylyltransferase MurU n=1 Tax=Paraglaciecola sp. 2405UD69-4 TaxID=3391836 RepID=UPI0039C96166